MHFTFKFKILLAIMFVVGIVSLASFFTIRSQVDHHFEQVFREQYGQQLALFQARQRERLESVTREVISNTGNPRLVAALLENDYSRFYYDLAKELQPLYLTLEKEYGLADFQPFFRFQKADGAYLKPNFSDKDTLEVPLAYMPGLSAPYGDEEIRQMLKGLDVYTGDFPETRSGYTVDRLGYETRLLKVFVCPVTDVFGSFLGDLFLVMPWSAGDLENVSVQQAIICEGEVFSGTTGQVEPKWNAILRLINRTDKGELSGQGRIQVSGQAFSLFSNKLEVGEGFPVAHQATLFSLDYQDTLLNRISYILILLALLGMILAFLISLVVAHGLHAPINRLRGAVNKVGQGDLTVNLNVKSRDEIGELTESFNEMTRGLALKEKYKSVLGKVTDSTVAEQLMRKEIELGGELRTATVLFCDIRGFTSMSDGMDAQELVALINEHMTAMTEIVYRYGGVVDKFVGDEIMVLFGVPVRVEDDAEKAIRCAIDMVKCCREMNRNRSHEICVGIGIAKGEMVAGCMGSIDRLNYTVIGERVNLASRFCGMAKKMEIIVDEDIYRSHSPLIPYAEKNESSVKGFEREPIYYLLKSEKI